MGLKSVARKLDEKLLELVCKVSSRPFALKATVGGLVTLAVVLAVLIRTTPYVLNEYEFLEFDSYIEYWQAEYVYRHGPLAWYTLTRENVDTHIFWYPWGRDFVYTSYPFLPMWIGTTYSIVQRLGLGLHQWAAIQPVLFAATATLVAYLAAVEVSSRRLAGILASYLYAILPSAVERSVIGYVEKEGVAATFIFLFVYFYAKSLKITYTTKKGWVKYIVPAAISLSLVGWLWGGYIFVLGAAVFYAILAPVLCREHFTKETALSGFLLTALSLVFVTPSPAVALSLGLCPLSLKGFGWAFLAASLLPLIFYYLGVEYRKLGFRKPVLTTSRYALLLAAFLVAGIAMAALGILPIGGRLAWALGLRFIGVHPLVESIAEHQSPLTNLDTITGMLHSWGAFFEGLARASRYLAVALGIIYLLALNVAGLLYLIYKGTPEKVFVGIAFAVAFYSYLNAVYMVGAASYFGVIVISAIVSVIASRAFPYSAELVTRKKPVKGPARKARGAVRTDATRVATLALLAVILANMAFTANTDYSLNASRVYTFKAGLSDLNFFTESWYRAVEAMRAIPGDAVVIAWWDYGYGISVVGGKASVADGSTLNATQIGIVGLIMWSNATEEAASLAKLFRSQPGSTYLMVVDGVFVVEEDDKIIVLPIPAGVFPGIVDWRKSLWMLRIGNATVDDLRMAGVYVDYVHSTRYLYAYINRYTGDTFIAPPLARPGDTPLVFKVVIDAALYWAEEVKGKRGEFRWLTGDEQVMPVTDVTRQSIRRYLGIDVEKQVMIAGLEALSERPLKNDTVLQPYAAIVEPFVNPWTGEPFRASLYGYNGVLYSVIAIYEFTHMPTTT